MAFKWYSKDQDLEEAVFQAAMYWRIAYGSARVFIGYKLLSLVGLPVVDAYQHLLHKEAIEDPQDPFFRLITHMLVHHGFFITYFLVVYLLFWGCIDIVLSVSMLRHYLWAFNASIVLIAFFIAYELYRFSHTHSPILFGFILIDILIIYIIRHERGRLIARKERKRQRKLLMNERVQESDSRERHDAERDPDEGAR